MPQPSGGSSALSWALLSVGSVAGVVGLLIWATTSTDSWDDLNRGLLGLSVLAAGLDCLVAAVAARTSARLAVLVLPVMYVPCWFGALRLLSALHWP